MQNILPLTQADGNVALLAIYKVVGIAMPARVANDPAVLRLREQRNMYWQRRRWQVNHGSCPRFGLAREPQELSNDRHIRVGESRCCGLDRSRRFHRRGC